MVNIYSKVEDLECTEHWGKADELRDLLKDNFDYFIEENDIDFTWLSDSHIAVDDEENADSIESDISDMLEEVYDNFIDAIETEAEEDEE